MRRQIVIYGRDHAGTKFAGRLGRKLGWQVDGLFGRSDRIEHGRDRRRIRPGVRAVLFLARRHRADAIVVRSLRDIEMTPCIVRRLIRSLARRRSVSFMARAMESVTRSANKMARPLRLRAARPMV